MLEVECVWFRWNNPKIWDNYAVIELMNWCQSRCVFEFSLHMHNLWWNFFSFLSYFFYEWLFRSAQSGKTYKKLFLFLHHQPMESSRIDKSPLDDVGRNAVCDVEGIYLEITIYRRLMMKMKILGNILCELRECAREPQNCFHRNRLHISLTLCFRRNSFFIIINIISAIELWKIQDLIQLLWNFLSSFALDTDFLEWWVPLKFHVQTLLALVPDFVNSRRTMKMRVLSLSLFSRKSLFMFGLCF